MTAAKKTPTLDIAALNEMGEYFVRSPETSEEHASRLKREEAEADHKLRMQEAEENHKRKLSFWMHIFVFAVVALAFLVGAYIAATGDPRAGLTEKAMNVITAIVAGGVGFITGKGSK